MYKLIKEGSARIYAPIEQKISKQLPVFYNPIMKLNRDITILLLQQFPPFNICDPLAASGIRAIRLAKEIKYKSIIANDLSKKAYSLIKKNIKLNKVKFEVKNEDANILLLKSKGFDFIDLDVFGSSNFMLDNSIKRLSRNGILAVTNTDTAALTGTYPKATLRKYWAISKKDAMMHETGLRILIRKIQLIAAQYDKALIPIFSYFGGHYFRVFLKNTKGKKEVDKVIKLHKTYKETGPLWSGQLWDKTLVTKMHNTLIKKNKIKKQNKKVTSNELIKFLKTIKGESKINTVGFYDIHKIVKKEKIKKIIKKADLIEKIKKSGFKAAETHFSGTGIRSNIPHKKFVNLLNNK